MLTWPRDTLNIVAQLLIAPGGAATSHENVEAAYHIEQGVPYRTPENKCCSWHKRNAKVEDRLSYL